MCYTEELYQSVRNVSKNTSNELNEVNYIEELRKDHKFCLSTWLDKSQDWSIIGDKIP